MSVFLHEGDCLDILNSMKAESVDSVVTDPPYGIGMMGATWDAPWQVSSESKLFGKRERKMPGFGTTRNPTCQTCGGRLRGAKKCSCDEPNWDEAVQATHQRQMSDFQDWCQQWAEEVYRVLKPGGHLLAFSGTRTYHRMVCGIEDAGFEVRDQIGWLYGSGFPKNLDVGKAIDSTLIHGNSHSTSLKKTNEDRPGDGRIGASLPNNGVMSGDRRTNIVRDDPATEAAKQWQGWGTAIKPSWEPVCVARKPIGSTVALNVLKHGTGAINIDGCRIETNENRDRPRGSFPHSDDAWGNGTLTHTEGSPLGRWPTNMIHDGSDEVMDAFPSTSSVTGQRSERSQMADVAGTNWLTTNHKSVEYTDSGSPARFFKTCEFTEEEQARRFIYCAKASKSERNGSKHPTIKPVALMRYLCRLVTPKNGIVLDPFAGSGTTGQAAAEEGFNVILIEREAEYCRDIRSRLAMFIDYDTSR
jgi:site-specific DNA-methyltransferase (adenine-specific)